MSSNFSWQTDEDEGWDEMVSHPSPPTPKRRFWLWGLVVCAAAILIPILIYTRLQKQVETATAQAEADVIAAHTLSQSAAANQDTDLFRSNLSRHDPYWADVQRELVSRGRFLDRSAFGLQWSAASTINQANPARPISLTLSPDLLSAEIIYTQEYQLTGSPVSEIPESQIIIPLQHIAHYRFSENRWLRADPLDAFWGALEEVEGKYLTLQYNNRDAALAPRLAQDLDEQLAVVCQTFQALDCDNLHLTLLLSRNPDYFFTLLDLEDILTTQDILRLPSPTLVGRPIDEVGYQFLLRGYATPLVSLALARLTGYECCHHGLFFRVLLEKELQQLDLGWATWLLTPDSYAVINPADAPQLITAAWEEETVHQVLNEEQLSVYSLIDFLTEATRPRLDITYWQSNLRRDITYWRWIAQRLTIPTDPNLFNTRWMNYILAQQQAISPPPIRLPQGELQISCMSSTVHYRPASNSWEESVPADTIFRTIPGGYLAQAVSYQGDARSLLMVQNNHTTIITGTKQANILYGASGSFASQPYPWFHFTTFDLTDSETRPQNWLVNLESCQDGECELRPLRGTPILSPNGQQMLVLVDSFGDGQLFDIYVTEPTAETMRQVGRGTWAAWLDHEHYAFYYNFSNRIEMYVGHIEDNTSQLAVTDSDLSDFFPEGYTDAPFHLTSIVTRPHTNHEIMLRTAYSGPTPYELIFHLTFDETWQTVIQTQLIGAGEPVVSSFSPDGRFYLFQELFAAERAVRLQDVASGMEQVYTWEQRPGSFISTPLWLDEGRWLAQVTDTEVILIAPHENYARRLPHAFENCNYAVYLPPGEPLDIRGR